MKRRGVALSEMMLTIAIIAVITTIGMFVYKSVLHTLSLNNETELLHHYLKNAQNIAEVYERSIKWEMLENKYIITDVEDGNIVKERLIPKHITIEGDSLNFNAQMRPEQGRTINLISGKKTRKITVDPSTGRIKLW